MRHQDWNGVLLVAEDRPREAGTLAAGVSPRTPRLLEALGVVLLTDPLEADLANMRRHGGVILENEDIPLVDPVAANQSAASGPWHMTHVNVAAARARGLTGNGVRIGVLDTGIDASHPEFAGKNIEFAEFDDHGMVTRVARDAGDHGTHVCGLIAGKTVGIAPAASLIVAAVMTRPTPTGMSGTLVQILRGMEWLLRTSFAAGGQPGRTDIINASIGLSPYTAHFHQTVSIALANPGSLMVAAIGNNGNNGAGYHCSPGNYDVVLGVGAVDRNDHVAAFKDWGSDWGLVAQHGIAKPDMVAPGVDIWSCVPGGGYAIKSGTSMAAPLAAGAAALLLQKHGQLAGNPVAVRQWITNMVVNVSAVGPNNLGRVGHGRLDLAGI
jgi:subtilisin family serine protease